MGFGIGLAVAGTGVADRVATGVGVAVGVAEAVVVDDAVAAGLFEEGGIAACWVVVVQAVSSRASAVIEITRCMSPGSTGPGYAHRAAGTIIARGEGKIERAAQPGDRVLVLPRGHCLHRRHPGATGL